MAELDNDQAVVKAAREPALDAHKQTALDSGREPIERGAVKITQAA